MSAAGPELPPHLLAKRKRQQEQESQDERDGASGAKRQKTPPTGTRRMGPTAPPAPLDERPDESADAAEASESSDEDDGFGPALPGQGTDSTAERQTQSISSQPQQATGKTSDASSKRDEWMMVPPKQDDLAARLDPTKPRARGFNTGKGASSATGLGDGTSAWTETPEEKRQRLANQVMGVQPTNTRAPSEAEAKSRTKREKDLDKAAKVKESRGKSLYDTHRQRADREEDDDPSQRAFDREKDIGKGTLGVKQREDFVKKSAGFGSKFSSGSFL